MEIERKFLLNGLPENLESYTCLIMEQAYISTNPVIRIRQKSVKNDKNSSPEYILTVKSTGLLSRQEYEIDIDRYAYKNLMSKAEGNAISKYRYLVPLDNSLTLELDVFKGAFEGLIIGEIEFPDEVSAKKYTPPEYLSEEVTFDTRFHNSTMSAMSASEISELVSLTHKCN